MASHSEKLRELVRILAKKTDRGEISWGTTLNGEGVLTTLKSGHIQIRPDRDDNGEDAIRISIFDESGDIKSTFDDTDINEPANEWSKQIIWFGQMKDLLDSAMRSAKGEDEIINAVLNELDDDVPF